jgi:CubicO group peptidase (beta-lactamase class C family)
MNRKELIILSCLLLVHLLFPACKRGQEEIPVRVFLGTGDYLGDYWPTTSWRTCAPSAVGMDPDLLYRAYEYAANTNIDTLGLVIIKNGYIVGESYFQEYTGNSRFQSYSIAKSFMSALFGIAIDNNHIENVNVPVSQWLTEWNSAPHEAAKQRISIENLLTMSSGLEWNEEDYYVDRSQNDVYRMLESNDYLEYIMNKSSIYEPGTRWYYSSGDSMLLSGLLQRAVNMTAYEYARQHLLAPIGADGITWESDPVGHTVGGWGILATVRDYAKFGYLYLNNGQWDGQQIISQQWIARSTQAARQNINWYGYQWWLAPVFSDLGSSPVPVNSFLAWGIFTQQIFVIPDLDLLIVRVGLDTSPGTDEWHEIEFLTLVINSIL